MRFTLLRARDPSIISCRLANVETGKSPVEVEEEDESHLQIYLRIKDIKESYEDLYEIVDSKTIISKVPERMNMMRSVRDEGMMMRKYDFSKIFKSETTQVEIFNELIKAKLLKFINGSNSTLMTYGVSSSGKTYTIVGTPEEPGIIPRSLEYLFKALPILAEKPTVKPLPYGTVSLLTTEQLKTDLQLKEKILNFKWPQSIKNEPVNTYSEMQNRLSGDTAAQIDSYSNSEVTVWVSFAEIYNEQIFDLLLPNTTKKESLKLGTTNDRTYVKNLNLVHVTSGLQAFQVLQYGLNNLNYAETRLNHHSSRSHSIFTLWLAQTENGRYEECHVSQFNFCDLAGAERSKKTLNIGNRLKESNNINTSLLVLGKCIASIRKAQHSSNNHIVPYRESKLTQLFKKPLSGQEDIFMVVNMNPCHQLFDETQHVLNFSAIAKDIVIVERPICAPKRNQRLTMLLEQSGNMANEDKLEKLKNELSEAVCKLEQLELNQMKKIEALMNRINGENAKELEEIKSEHNYQLYILEGRLNEELEKELKSAEEELLKEYGLDPSDLVEPNSSVEVIDISSSDEESDDVGVTVISSSDEDMTDEESDLSDKEDVIMISSSDEEDANKDQRVKEKMDLGPTSTESFGTDSDKEGMNVVENKKGAPKISTESEDPDSENTEMLENKRGLQQILIEENKKKIAQLKERIDAFHSCSDKDLELTIPEKDLSIQKEWEEKLD